MHIENNINLRELMIPFGDSGYVALYRYDNINNTVYILSFKHQKEVEYCIST